jgi:hypothetical protein
MAKKPDYEKNKREARKAYYKKHKFQGPLTEAQENAAYEEDMRRRSGAKDPNDPGNWRRDAKPQRKYKVK